MDSDTKDKFMLCSGQEIDLKAFWLLLKQEAEEMADQEESLRPLLTEVLLSREDFADCLATRLARKLSRDDMPQAYVHDISTLR